MCEEGGRSEKMFEGKCEGDISFFILFFIISCNLKLQLMFVMIANENPKMYSFQ